eukprot:1621713-Pyramimonas_sp.AAC.1
MTTRAMTTLVTGDDVDDSSTTTSRDDDSDESPWPSPRPRPQEIADEGTLKLLLHFRDDVLRASETGLLSVDFYDMLYNL